MPLTLLHFRHTSEFDIVDIPTGAGIGAVVQYSVAPANIHTRLAVGDLADIVLERRTGKCELSENASSSYYDIPCSFREFMEIDHDVGRIRDVHFDAEIVSGIADRCPVDLGVRTFPFSSQGTIRLFVFVRKIAEHLTFMEMNGARRSKRFSMTHEPANGGE